MAATRLHRCWQLVRYFGPTWLIYRVTYAARLKSGLIRSQLPASIWAEQPLARWLADKSLADPQTYAAYRQSSCPPFLFDPSDAEKFRSNFVQWDSKETSPLSAAADIGDGFLRFFSQERVDVGFPPQWHVDPVTGHSFPTDRHWSQIGDFSGGDIKLVWETNRFAFVFPLVRSYWRTGNEQYAEQFWQLVESWHQSNPPGMGPNWKCGQEISLRVMAWCFGLYGFRNSDRSTPARVALLAQAIAVSGRRIEFNIDYALSQKNNHGLSEAMGLFTIGSLFPEFAASIRWQNRGRELLESQALELIYDDGSFSQHSMNYHRVMLHDYLWSIRLGDVLGKPFSDSLKERITKAGEFVFQLQDESTGRVPCYGQDDGALILPLSNCDARDYRPVVQATHFLATGRRRFDAGPWDEDLFWLFGVAKYDQPPAIDSIDSLTDKSNSSRRHTCADFDAPDGGYVTLRSSNGFAATRAASYRHRPAQADMLHVDIWWRGENIAIDPGTYSYNAPPPWNNPFAHSACHNTVTVDSVDQMERVSRFLWLPWLKGKSFGRNVVCHGDVTCWNGEHDGYRRLADPVTHRRGVVRLGTDHWLIVDALKGHQQHNYHLHWLLLDAPYQSDVEQTSIELQTAAGRYRLATATSAAEAQFRVTRAPEDSAMGWRSCYYHSREPALSVNIECQASAIVFATVLGPDAQRPLIERDRVHVAGPDWNALITLDLSTFFGTPLVTSVAASGSLTNSVSSIAHFPRRPRTEPRPCTYC